MKYTWGGETPEAGFDCSGYVSWALGVQRGTADSMFRSLGHPVLGHEAWRPGDVLFFKRAQGRVQHMGIYLGGGLIQHSSSKRGVVVDRIKPEDPSNWFWANYVGARRIKPRSSRNIRMGQRYNR